jgi:HD domain
MSLRPYLWQVALATFFVAAFPLSVVWSLRATGVMSSMLLGMLLAVGLSLGASYLGRTLWEKRTGSGDLLFGELMAWGFVRRWRNERRLASALELLGSMNEAQRRVAGGLTAESQAQALEQLSGALEARDPSTHGHSRRVARHAWMIAQRMGLSREQVARIRTAAAVHDVGKLETPPEILRKPGPLSDDEFDAVKQHPVDGARLTGVLGDQELTAIVRHHHERLDGTGYPARLHGEDIPLGARIIAVADTFDAITSPRPYRSARPHRAAVEILKREAGSQLDPAVVQAFCALYSGRRSLLALWASVSSLPGQAFSSLGGGVSGVATAAKVFTVAAIVGTASVGTSTLARPATHHHRALADSASVAATTGTPPTTYATSAPLVLQSGAGQGSRARRSPSAHVAALRALAGTTPVLPLAPTSSVATPVVSGTLPSIAPGQGSSGSSPATPPSVEGASPTAGGGQAGVHPLVPVKRNDVGHRTPAPLGSVGGGRKTPQLDPKKTVPLKGNVGGRKAPAPVKRPGVGKASTPPKTTTGTTTSTSTKTTTTSTTTPTPTKTTTGTTTPTATKTTTGTTTPTPTKTTTGTTTPAPTKTTTGSTAPAPA